jgi:hypothetical protein
MYDGTACTAGLHQAIAVYPRELRHEDFAAADDQGSLWKLLRMLEMVPYFPALEALWDHFASVNWYVASDGYARYLEDSVVRVKNRNLSVKAGDLVYGADIRETFTPNGGAVPARGRKWEESKAWALIFHRVFADPKGFRAQVKFGQEHFHRYCERKRLKVGDQTLLAGEWLYEGRSDAPSVTNEALDLALSVFWSHSVNGPTKAWGILKRALAKNSVDDSAFAPDLLRRLGNSTYGRWSHTEKSGRWARTRRAAMRSGYWSPELFKVGGLMPKTL